jgi:hypothetical protein
MDRMIVKSRVGADGVLHVSIPLGLDDANRDVSVTIDPAPHPPSTQEEWRNFLASTAGAWQGDFERPEQGELEQRDPFP